MASTAKVKVIISIIGRDGNEKILTSNERQFAHDENAINWFKRMEIIINALFDMWK